MKPLAGDAGPEESAAHESLACSDPAARQKLKPTPGSTRCYACAAACLLAGFAPCVPCRYRTRFPGRLFWPRYFPLSVPSRSRKLFSRRTLLLLPRRILTRKVCRGNRTIIGDRSIDRSIGKLRRGWSRRTISAVRPRSRGPPPRQAFSPTARPHPRRLSVPTRQRATGTRGVHTGAGESPRVIPGSLPARRGPTDSPGRSASGSAPPRYGNSTGPT